LLYLMFEQHKFLDQSDFEYHQSANYYLMEMLENLQGILHSLSY